MSLTWFNNILLPDLVKPAQGKWVAITVGNEAGSWSFSEEWKEHAATDQQRTWDMTAAERLVRFFDETRTTADSIRDLIVLDAGSGNGQLSRAIAETGAKVVGIDRQPHLPAGTDNVQFVQGDFDHPPFLPASFDIIIANGSIHHTKNTLRSFRSLADLVKPGGRLYVFVYKKQKGWRSFMLWWLDLFRFFISRSGPRIQRVCVAIITQFFFTLSRIRKGGNSKRSKEEIRINIYDAFTPRYRHYHEPGQVREWFLDNGFNEPVITLANDAYGFGMLGVKISR
ncbi:MAG TPA: class I SAM-dependent methyltransferase [Chitinophagaceae bacterium]|nr:class I SAM-dependent methyltransferase [Chitinophagaceae bacterium]